MNVGGPRNGPPRPPALVTPRGTGGAPRAGGAGTRGVDEDVFAFAADALGADGVEAAAEHFDEGAGVAAATPAPSSECSAAASTPSAPNASAAKAKTSSSTPRVPAPPARGAPPVPRGVTSAGGRGGPFRG